MNANSQQARFKAAVVGVGKCARALTCFETGFTCLKLIYSSIALDGGSVKEADGYSQRFLFLRSVASVLEKPMLAGYWRTGRSNRHHSLTSSIKREIRHFHVVVMRGR